MFSILSLSTVTYSRHIIHYHNIVAIKGIKLLTKYLYFLLPEQESLVCDLMNLHFSVL